MNELIASGREAGRQAMAAGEMSIADSEFLDALAAAARVRGDH